MALSKDIVVSSGVTTSYHMITNFIIDVNRKSCTFEVGHFLNQTLRTNNYQPLEKSHYRVKEEDFFLTAGGNWQEECYEYLKTLDEWSDALDV